MKSKKFLITLVSSFLIASCNSSNTWIEGVYAFSEGLLPVVMGSKSGYVNMDGEVKIPFIFDKAYHFHKKIAVVANNNIALDKYDYFFINEIGQRINESNFDSIILDKATDNYIVKSSIGYSLLNDKGENITTSYPNLGESYSDGLISFYDGLKWGFLGSDGKVVISPTYQATLGFSNGLAAVKLNDLWGFINPQGQFIIPSKYIDIISNFNVTGNAIVKSDSNTSVLIDKNDIILLRGFEISGPGPLYRFRENNISDTPYRLVNWRGEFFNSTPYYRIWGFYGDYSLNIQYSSSNSTDQMVVFNENGSVYKSQSYYSSDFHFDDSKNELYLADYSSNENIILLNISTKKQTILIGNSVERIHNGYVTFTKNEIFGLYNPDGELIIPITYEFLFVTRDNFVFFGSNSKIGVLKMDGSILLNATYDFVYPFKPLT